MVCEICKKKEAVLFIKEVVLGKQRTYALCEDCAKKQKDVMLPQNLQIEEIIKSLLEFTEEDDKKKEVKKPLKKHKNKRCPVCGSTYDEVILASTCGCSECYKTFRSDIDEIVDKVSKTISYQGLAPKKNTKKKTTEEEKIISLRDYRKELNEAIKVEDYEKAAKLRDLIKELEGKDTKKKAVKKTTAKKTTTTRKKKDNGSSK